MSVYEISGHCMCQEESKGAKKSRRKEIEASMQVNGATSILADILPSIWGKDGVTGKGS